MSRLLPRLPRSGLGVLAVLAVLSSVVMWFETIRPTVGLQVWAFDPGHVDVYRLLVPGWNRLHPGHPLALNVLSGSALQTRMMSGFLAGTPVADLLEIERTQTGPVFAGPIDGIGFVDLTDRLRREGLLDQINAASFSPWTTRGHIFGLPHDVHPVMLAYRRDLVEAAGIDVSRIETWDDYFRAMRPLMRDLDGDGRGDCYPLNGTYANPSTAEVILLQAGGTFFTDDGQANLDTEINAEILARLATWFEGPGRVIGDANLGTVSGQQMVHSGFVIGIIAPDFFAGSMTTMLTDMAGQFKLMPLPAWRPGGRRTSVQGGTMMGIARSTPDVDLAWAALKELYLSPVSAEHLFRDRGIVTPVKANWGHPVFDEPSAFFSGQPVGRLYLRLAPSVPLRPSSPYYTHATTYLGNVAHQLATMADREAISDPAQLLPRARALLAAAQRDLQAQMRRNTFLARPTP
ncbi:MAG TPA: extracellular solute-binding protein [Opitutaceae bacterium]|nr:extracellular solute-binding protein [Opitutaceae bacterium]HND62288.1 extracellular solute-binding protein [Opitutaceae bacterium]